MSSKAVCAAAHGKLAYAYGLAAVHYTSIPRDEGLRLNIMHAQKAVELDPADADGHAGLAAALIWSGDMENALLTARRALSINPNCAGGYNGLGAILIFTSKTAEGRAAYARFERLSPRDPGIADAHHVIAQSFYLDRDHEACVAVLRRQLSDYPDYPLTHYVLARALGQPGRTKEARASLEKSKALLSAGFNPANRAPWARPEDHEYVLDRLRKAGWEG
jgi:Flp pilus assembly protein TadD